MARNLASKPPLAVRTIKQVLSQSAGLLQQASAEDAMHFADTIGSTDFAEAMAAWFEKRPGKFSGS